MMPLSPTSAVALRAMFMGFEIVLKISLPVLPPFHTWSTEQCFSIFLAGLVLELVLLSIVLKIMMVLLTIVLKIMMVPCCRIKDFVWNFVHLHFGAYGHVCLTACTAVCRSTVQKMVPALLLDLMPRVLQNALAYKPPLLRFATQRDGEYIFVMRTKGQADAVDAVKKIVPAFLLHLMPRVVQEEVFAYRPLPRVRAVMRYPLPRVTAVMTYPNGVYVSPWSKKGMQRG